MPPHVTASGPIPPGADPEEYDRRRRRVLWKMPTGLYLLGSSDGARRNLMTCNFAVQVSMAPKFIAVGVEREALTHELIASSGRYCLGLLRSDDRAVVRHFVKPATDDRAAMTLSGHAYFDAAQTGCPVLASCFAYLDARLEHTVELGSHSLFIGEVVDANFLGDEDGDVLTMADTRMNYGG